MNQLTEVDLHWVAGLLEGEGSFVVASRRGNRRGQLKACMGSVDQDVDDRLHRTIGAGHIIQTKPTKGGKDFWMWNLTRQGEAIELMKLLRPHMSQRRQRQIDKCVKHYRARPRGKNQFAPSGTHYCYSCQKYLPLKRWPENYKKASRCRRCMRSYTRMRRQRIADGTWESRETTVG